MTKHLCRILAACVMAAGAAQAELILNYIPGPDDTGGMVMPGVGLNFTTKTVSVSLSGMSNTVDMYPLQQYEVWGEQPYANAVFNPALSSAGWYDQLDPTQQNLPFSTQYGFFLASGNVSLLPSGSYVYIKALSISEGLTGYDVGYYDDVWASAHPSSSEWIQVFGEGSEWNNTVAWGDSSGLSMWHPVFITEGFGLYSATFQIYVGDGAGNPLSDWTAASITLNWNAIPEPATILTSILGLIGAVYYARRKKAVPPSSIV